MVYSRVFFFFFLFNLVNSFVLFSRRESHLLFMRLASSFFGCSVNNVSFSVFKNHCSLILNK